VNFPCIYSNIQAVPASHCELSVYVYQHSGSTCIPLWTFRICITTFRQYLHPIVNFPYMYSNIQAVPASHCELNVRPECCYTYTESLQWDAGTAWMLLYIHGKFTMGCRYCLNVAMHTRKVHNGMQVLPECCYTYTESSQWDACTAWMLLYIYGKFTMGYRLRLHVSIATFRQYLHPTVNFQCMHSNIQA
jgi:hypothetical protein